MFANVLNKARFNVLYFLLANCFYFFSICSAILTLVITDKLMPGVPKALEIRTDFTVLTVTFHSK